ncbi:ArsR family transcriptional regulator [Humitalea rosea]|uniref:ArsR family transcriptional regulator n=1 Tax=Humitalea rosea TaxID=990373 RepID=A0A2W7IKE3_9PROT|nr:metalloregulator ArsR/SmtB family transcription factor [Humitalea rosea]PZW39003.1 ArsR family transcriptional regulator [Humitalea rosea]
MESLLTALRAAAEPTRLRLLALCARGGFCVTELVAILGQSQPRLSRHLRLLVEAGLLERVPEGANAWFHLADRDALARDLIARLGPDDPHLAADARAAARVLAERARAASEAFRRSGTEWDEASALELPAEAIEAALLTALPPGRLEAVLDIGTGTGRLLELLAPRAASLLGVDASRDMLALARARLAGLGIGHAALRQADMYRLPLPDGGFDLVAMQMVLHYAEDPTAALAEAVRVLRPGGTLLLLDLAPHDRADLAQRHAHRWQGFSDAEIAGWLGGCDVAPAIAIPGPLTARLWAARSTVQSSTLAA